MLTKWANACYHWVYKFTCGRNSVVECRLPKPNAVGSNPIARFLFLHKELRQFFSLVFFSFVPSILQRQAIADPIIIGAIISYRWAV
jgi:hypothetical protein